MDAGLFLILVICAMVFIHIFDKIFDYLTYKPKHVTKTEDKEFWEGDE